MPIVLPSIFWSRIGDICRVSVKSVLKWTELKWASLSFDQCDHYYAGMTDSWDTIINLLESSDVVPLTCKYLYIDTQNHSRTQ